ncbi:hypothetical protein CMQ_3966 [Grosmannia clavigera kw1407]|uniref:Magnesium chelatase n=1 Tax=Grosmannia clavigera (strain kw1407 / UAMH 11150) TaxID=655863 RepID=F0X982_GROCL|nr:uncharacterized protein CMQ_3966 [Grosmannia clavigera kw1407]EFX05897.1 hypothetical protein CMQ_3966 [Grosmannia clavigera kw1407]
MGSNDELINRVHSLSDLELAVLLSLISQEHCVIGTSGVVLDDLVDELFLISSKVFGLRCVVVDCHKHMTLDEFQASIIITGTLSTPTAATGTGSGHDGAGNRNSHDYVHLPAARHDRLGPRSLRSPPPAFLMMTSASATSTTTSPAAAIPAMANVILAKNLNRAPETVQIQALELLRAGGLLPRTAVQVAPRPFLFLAVVAAEPGFRWGGGNGDKTAGKKEDDVEEDQPPHMTAYLNDFFAMGHWHNPDDGFPNLDDDEEASHQQDRGDAANDSDGSSDDNVDSIAFKNGDLGSRIRGDNNVASTSRASAYSTLDPVPFLSEADRSRLTALSRDVRIDVDVLRYQMNVVAFLRMHRAVAVIGKGCSGISSISPTATKHFEKLTQCLAPLHQLDYVTPSLVALAARKVYLHRIRTVETGDSSAGAALQERSMQWGSTREAVEAMLDGISPEGIIEEVLDGVAPPV